MLNPDGVILGNFRTGVAGMDLNRWFMNPDTTFYPTVNALKELCEKMTKNFGDNLISFLDFHGHSQKKNVFMYGPDFPIYKTNFYKCRILAKMLD